MMFCDIQVHLRIEHAMFKMSLMNQEEALEYKRQFILTLKPVLEMLEYKRLRMDSDDWSLNVIEVESSIINNPEQYLGKNLPNVHVVVRLIKEIFEDFLQDQPNYS